VAHSAPALRSDVESILGITCLVKNRSYLFVPVADQAEDAPPSLHFSARTGALDRRRCIMATRTY
jgi:hypothetical protein